MVGRTTGPTERHVSTTLNSEVDFSSCLRDGGKDTLTEGNVPFDESPTRTCYLTIERFFEEVLLVPVGVKPFKRR